MYFHLENWISDMASSKNSSFLRNMANAVKKPSTNKNTSQQRANNPNYVAPTPTNKNTSQERSNFGSVARARIVDAENAAAAGGQAGSGYSGALGNIRAAAQQAKENGMPGRDAAAALGRSNAPAVRLQGNPPPGMMASGLRQYQPQSMPDMGRPTPQGDPNDAYGWGQTDISGLKDQYSRDNSQYDSDGDGKISFEEQRGANKDNAGTFQSGGGSFRADSAAHAKEMWDSGRIPTSRMSGSPAIGQNPMFSREQVNDPQIQPFGGSGGPSWLEKARSSSGMGGGGGMRPQQPQQPMQQPAPGMAAGGMQQPRPQPQMRPNPSQAMGGGGGSALQQALRGGA
jgi:hypothetical protein